MGHVTKSPSTILGSIVKLQYSDVADVVSIPDANINNQVLASGISFAAGKQWYLFDRLPGCKLECSCEDTEQGPVYTNVISGKIVLAATDIIKISIMLKQRHILRATDGNGIDWLCGTKTEFFIFAYKLNTNESRAQSKVFDFTFSAKLSADIFQLV